MALAKELEFYTTAGGRTEEEIARSEALLGLKFSRQYRAFNMDYGYLSFSGHEIFGVDPDDLEELERNALAYALHDREAWHLPAHLLPIYNFDDGCMAYLDFSSRNSEGEPRVVMAESSGEGYEIVQPLAEDFGDFLLTLVEEP